MSRAMRGALIAFAVLVAASGCSTGRPGSSPLSRPSEAERTVRRAALLTLDGDGTAARDLYARVIREDADDPASTEALYRLGILLVSPTSGIRDYRAAHLIFTRLLTERPGSPWDVESRAWQVALGDMLAQEAETKRLKGLIQRLRQVDLDLERRR